MGNGGLVYGECADIITAPNTSMLVSLVTLPRPCAGGFLFRGGFHNRRPERPQVTNNFFLSLVDLINLGTAVC